MAASIPFGMWQLHRIFCLLAVGMILYIAYYIYYIAYDE